MAQLVGETFSTAQEVPVSQPEIVQEPSVQEAAAAEEQTQEEDAEVQQMKARFVISFNLATYRFEGALLDQSLLVVQAGSTVSTVVEGSDSGCGLVLRLRGAFLGQSGRRRLGAHGQGRQEVREALVPARLLIIIDAHGVVEALRRAARPRCPPPPRC
jgi:hypothetical protein